MKCDACRPAPYIYTAPYMSNDSLKPQPQEEVLLPLDVKLQVLETQVVHLHTALTQAQMLFRDSPAALFLLNNQGFILDVNTRGTALLRSARDILLGRTLTSSLASSSRTTFTTLLTQVFEGREQQRQEVQLVLPGGEVLEVVVDAGLHAGNEDTPQGQVTLTDVTAFKLAHRVLWNTQQAQALELQAQDLKLQLLREEYENVMLMAGRELETLLTRATNFLALSQRHPETPGHVDHAAEALRHTQTLLDSLKGYMQMRFLRTRIRPVSLNQVFHEVLKDVQNQLVDREVQITSDALPTVSGDSQVLQIIMREYMSNALKFTRTRSQARVHVLVEEEDTEYRIGVEDNGVGFSMRQREKAFELFGRLHHNGLYKGTGLGLTVVRRLCERFGGRTWAEGKVDQGATFWFSWPKTPAGK